MQDEAFLSGESDRFAQRNRSHFTDWDPAEDQIFRVLQEFGLQPKRILDSAVVWVLGSGLV